MQKDGRAMRQLLTLVALQGPQHLSKEMCHNIADEIYQFKKGSIRVAWFYDAGKMVICCHAFVKKSQKTPKETIELSIESLRCYRLAKARNAIEEI